MVVLKSKKIYILLIFILFLILFFQVSAADTNIENDIVTTNDLMYSNSTIYLSANITIKENGSLLMDNCLIIINGTNISSVFKISFYDNASANISNCTFQPIDGTDRYQFVSYTENSVVLSRSKIIQGGLENTFGEVFRATDSRIWMKDTKFEGCKSNVHLESCPYVTLSNVSWTGFKGNGFDLEYCNEVSVIGCKYWGCLEGKGLSISACNGVRIGFSNFTDNKIGIYISSNSRNVDVYSCRFVRNHGSAIRIFYNKVSPGPSIRKCEFLENDVGIFGDFNAHHVKIQNCTFRFEHIGIYVSGKNWLVEDNIFEYCTTGINEHFVNTFFIRRNRFISSVMQGIWIENTDESIVVNIIDNTFIKGVGAGISISFLGKAIIHNNSFINLQGGGLFISRAVSIEAHDNEFRNCSYGIDCRNIPLDVYNSIFEGCDVGLALMNSTVRLFDCTFIKVHEVLVLDNAFAEIISGVVQANGSISCDRSELRIGPDFAMNGLRIHISNGTTASIRNNPSTSDVALRVDGGSVLDIINQSIPKMTEIADDLSMIRLWWTISIQVLTLSDDSPLPGLQVSVFDGSFEQVAMAKTGPTGATPMIDVLTLVQYRDGTESTNPHTISTTYKGVEISREANITTAETIIIHVDDIPPSISISTPMNGTVLENASVEIRGTIADESRVTTLSISVDGGLPISIPPTSPWKAHVDLDDGMHRIVVFADDVLGNEGRAEISIRVDLFPPFMQITRPEKGAVLSTDHLDIEGFTEPQLEVHSLDVSTISDMGGNFHLYIPLAREGAQDIVVTVVDAFGRTSSVAVSVHVDWTPPEVTFDEGSSLVNTTEPIIKGHVSEKVQSLEIQGKAVRVDTDSSFSVVLDLLEGPNEVVWECVDIAGNVGAGDFSVVVDTMVNLTVEHPEQGDRVNQGWLEVRGRTDPDVRIEELGIGATTVPTTNGSFSIQVWSGDEGLNKIAVKVTDAAGNSKVETIEYEVIPPPPPPKADTPWQYIAVITLLLAISSGLVIFYFQRRGGADGESQ